MGEGSQASSDASSGLRVSPRAGGVTFLLKGPVKPVVIVCGATTVVVQIDEWKEGVSVTESGHEFKIRVSLSSLSDDKRVIVGCYSQEATLVGMCEARVESFGLNEAKELTSEPLTEFATDEWTGSGVLLASVTRKDGSWKVHLTNRPCPAKNAKELIKAAMGDNVASSSILSASASSIAWLSDEVVGGSLSSSEGSATTEALNLLFKLKEAHAKQLRLMNELTKATRADDLRRFLLTERELHLKMQAETELRFALNTLQEPAEEARSSPAPLPEEELLEALALVHTAPQEMRRAWNNFVDHGSLSARHLRRKMETDESIRELERFVSRFARQWR